MVAWFSEFADRLGYMEHARKLENETLYAHLRDRLPGFAEAGSSGPPHQVQPLPPTSTQFDAAAAETTDPAVAVGAFIGTGQESEVDDAEVSDSESALAVDEGPVSELPLEVRPPSSTMEREAFNKAMMRVSPKSCQLIAPVVTTEVHTYLPSSARAFETVEWATPRFTQDAVTRLSAKLQGSLTLDPAPYRNRSLRPPSWDYFKPSNVMAKDSFRLKLSDQSLLQQKAASQNSFFPGVDVPQTYSVSAQWFKDTQELCQRASIACGQALAGAAASIKLVTESVADIHEVMPEFQPTQHIYMTALMDSQNQVAAAAANFELVRRDHVLNRLGVPTEDARLARAAPLAEAELFGHDTLDFVRFITDQTKEARLVGEKYLHGPTLYKPKVTQAVKSKPAAGYTIPKVQQPFRKQGPPKAAYVAPTSAPPSTGGKRVARSKGKGRGKQHPATVTGKQAGAGAAPL